MLEKERIPTHIAIIMDGNGRWAKQRGLPRTAGHTEGMKAVRRVLKYSNKLGIKYLTIYAFSTENWKRPKLEVNALMKLFKEYLKKERKDLKESNVRLEFSGTEVNIPKDLKEAMTAAKEYLKDCTGITLNIAFNYGSRLEIVEAVNKVLKEGKANISEEEFSKYLYNNYIPDPDLLIRTSGELRISNFMLWQIAYSEFYFSEKYWPDFQEEDLDKAIEDFNNRKRRYGGL